MANTLFRSRATTLVRTAILESQSAGAIDHAGLRGRIREIAVDRLFTPLLPSEFRIGTGKIVDSEDRQSAETDLIIYSPRLLAPVLFAERDGVFPIDACFYAVEVKSEATAREIADAVGKAKRLRELRYAAGEFAPNGTALAHEVHPVVPTFFSFASDLSNSGKTELERYAEHDPGWRTSPAIRAICVAGVGYWFFVPLFQRWGYWRATGDGDEVVNYLAGVINTLPGALASRRSPRIGNYLILEQGLEWF